MLQIWGSGLQDALAGGGLPDGRGGVTFGALLGVQKRKELIKAMLDTRVFQVKLPSLHVLQLEYGEPCIYVY